MEIKSESKDSFSKTEEKDKQIIEPLKLPIKGLEIRLRKYSIEEKIRNLK